MPKPEAVSAGVRRLPRLDRMHSIGIAKIAVLARQTGDPFTRNRLRGEFVSTVSHELRTPLTSIRGSLSLLSAGVLGDLPADAKDVVDIAERNVVRLVTLINDILDLEKLDAGKLDMQLAPVRVQLLMDRASEAVRGFADQEGIAIAHTATDAVANVDDGRIVQVLVNLLSNAIKFSRRGSTVTVEASTVDDEVEIRVIDRGRGIPRESLELIFERFRQVDSSDARRKGGTGLGLAICKAIMAQHGAGSSVRDHGLADVLLVEDDAAFAQVTALKLAQQGIFTRIADSAGRAATMMRERLPGLVVLDIGLADADGFELVTRLRRDDKAKRLPLLVYSGRDIGAAERDRLTLGPTRFLTKSRASDDDFMETVEELLGKPTAKKPANPPPRNTFKS